MPQQSASEKRKPRIPLSPEELFYFIQIKKLKKTQQLLEFKKSGYYKRLNTVNILFVFIISYIVLSAIFLCRWQRAYVLQVDTSYEASISGLQRSISDVHINTVGGEDLHIKTSGLYQTPKRFESIWVGRDYVFGKVLKAKLFKHGGEYFHVNVFPLFFICLFVIFVVYLIYHCNMHLTRHGLFGITTLLSLAFLYILCI